MVEFAGLVGLLPHLGKARKVVYFHENQFAYPTRDTNFNIQFGVAHVYTALAADAVIFNSEFNRRTLLEGVQWLCRALPDLTPAETADIIEARSSVVPVGLAPQWYTDGKAAGKTGPLRLLWNHRWEYDKAPDRFFAALRLLHERGVDFRVEVVGQQFRKIPPAFEAGRNDLGSHIGQWGFLAELEDYRKLLRRCDVVVSTALHEFQGLAVLEAIASGCIAAAPDRLSYPEFLPDWCLYDSHPDDPARDARKLADHLEQIANRLAEVRAGEPIDLENLRWNSLRDDYARVFTG